MNKDELEVLIPPGSKFEVVGVRNDFQIGPDTQNDFAQRYITGRLIQE